MARYFGLAGAIDATGCEDANGTIDFSRCPNCRFKPAALPSCFFSVREQTLADALNWAPDDIEQQLLAQPDISLETVKLILAMIPDPMACDEFFRPVCASLRSLCEAAVRNDCGLESDDP